MVLANVRSTPAKYAKSTPVDKDESAIAGISDNSRIRMDRQKKGLRNMLIGEQTSITNKRGNNTTRLANKPRLSSTPPPNSSNKENKSPSEW